jgi:hypothetical protein
VSVISLQNDVNEILDLFTRDTKSQPISSPADVSLVHKCKQSFSPVYCSLQLGLFPKQSTEYTSQRSGAYEYRNTDIYIYITIQRNKLRQAIWNRLHFAILIYVRVHYTKYRYINAWRGCRGEFFVLIVISKVLVGPLDVNNRSLINGIGVTNL